MVSNNFCYITSKSNVKKSKLNMGKKRGCKAEIHAHIPAGICKIRTWVPILLL